MKPLRIHLRHSTEILVEDGRIELPLHACKAHVLPLSLIPHCSASPGGNLVCRLAPLLLWLPVWFNAYVTHTFHPLPDKDRYRTASGLSV